MQIEVRLFASLRDRLPREARGRGEVEVQAGASLADLLDLLAIPPKQAQMVLVNGDPVPRTPGLREATRLEKGDTVSIFPPVAGG